MRIELPIFFPCITTLLFLTRKDYLLIFKAISSATASRDLKYGVEKGLIEKLGDKRLTRYRSIGS